jgi:hypothetical protein
VVIGPGFAWAHLPKTAGDATAAMLASVPGLVEFADPSDSPDKHLPFFAREELLAGKLLVMNIRRLPAWALSGAHHKAAHGLHPDYTPLPLETADQIVARSDADDLLRWMTDAGRIRVGFWLRMEMLEHDVLALLEHLGVPLAQARPAVAAVGQVNVGDYDRALERRFTPEQIRSLYDRNPNWAAIERMVYDERPALPGLWANAHT